MAINPWLLRPNEKVQGVAELQHLDSGFSAVPAWGGHCWGVEGRGEGSGPQMGKNTTKKSHLQERAGSKRALCPPSRADPVAAPSWLCSSPWFLWFIPQTSHKLPWVQVSPCPTRG